MNEIIIDLLTNNSVIPFQKLGKETKLAFLKFNKLFATKSLAEHGLGFLLRIFNEPQDIHEYMRTPLLKIIFDTGSLNQTFLHNLDIRGHSLYDTDYIILSHWHYDHTGALYNILERCGSDVSVITHPDAKNKRIFLRSDNISASDLTGKSCKDIEEFLNTSQIVLNSPIDESKFKEKDIGIKMTKNRKILFENADIKIWVSGEIPRVHKEETFDNFLIIRNDIITQDSILDDKCLVIELKDNTILLNGCCHSGIINTLDYVKSHTQKPVSHIIGGFHMTSASNNRLKTTLHYLKTFQSYKKPIYLFPIHCSGEKFIQSINNMKSDMIHAFNCSVGTQFCFNSKI